MALATAEGVRALLSDLGVTIITEAKVTRAITQADAIVQTGTRKYDWVVTDRDYYTAVSAAEHLASSIILEGMQDEENDSREQRDMGRSLINSIREALKEEDITEELDDDVVIERQPFTTRPLNPDAVYRRETTSEIISNGEGVANL